MEFVMCHVCSLQLGRIAHCKETFPICSLDYIKHWNDCIQHEELTAPTTMLVSVTGCHLPIKHRRPSCTLYQGQLLSTLLCLSCTAPLYAHWHCPKAPQAREGLPEGWSEVWGVPQPQQWVRLPGDKGRNRTIFKPQGAYTIRHKPR